MNMIKLRSLVFAAFLALPFATSFAEVDIISKLGSSASAGSGATALSGRRIYLDSGLLGLGRLLQRLLLGSRRLGPSAESGSALDPVLVGLEKRRVRV